MKARPIVPPVPYAVRLLLTIGCLLVANGLAALAAWITPEVSGR